MIPAESLGLERDHAEWKGDYKPADRDTASQQMTYKLGPDSDSVLCITENAHWNHAYSDCMNRLKRNPILEEPHEPMDYIVYLGAYAILHSLRNAVPGYSTVRCRRWPGALDLYFPVISFASIKSRRGGYPSIPWIPPIRRRGYYKLRGEAP